MEARIEGSTTILAELTRALRGPEVQLTERDGVFIHNGTRIDGLSDATSVRRESERIINGVAVTMRLKHSGRGGSGRGVEQSRGAWVKDEGEDPALTLFSLEPVSNLNGQGRPISGREGDRKTPALRAHDKTGRRRRVYLGRINVSIWLPYCYPTNCGNSSNRSCRFHRSTQRAEGRAYRTGPASPASSSCCAAAFRGRCYRENSAVARA